MRYRNRKTSEIIEISGYVQEFAYGHNSEWERVIEEKKVSKKRVDRSKEDEV